MNTEPIKPMNAETTSPSPHVPKLSIGMPVYNGEPFIREALDSLLAQTFTDFELIISDNASTDGTESICQEYAAKDARIRYVRQAKNLGATANFQFVLNESVGEYFLWTAADDSQKETFIEKLVSVLDQNKSLHCAMSDVENIFDNPGQPSEISRLTDIRLDPVLKNWKKHRVRFFRNPTSNIFFCIYGIYRSNVLKQVELNYRGLVKYAAASEVPFLAQLAIMGPLCSIPESLKIYRRHKSSMYQCEQSSLAFWSRCRGTINVSKVLTLVITESSLPALEKMGLYVTVLYTGLQYCGIILKRILIVSIQKAWINIKK